MLTHWYQGWFPILFFRFRKYHINLLWQNEIKLDKYLRPGDSVDGSTVGDFVDNSGMGDSVGGLEVVTSVGGSVGIFMHTPSSHFSSGPQSVLAFSHSFWKTKYSREIPSYVALIVAVFF